MTYIRHVGFLKAASLGFRNYADFRGRAQRAEYWWFQFFVFLISIGITLAGQFVFSWDEGEWLRSQALWNLAIIVPTLALGWRRMHDLGKSGWWNILPLAPLVWAVTAVIILSEMDDNESPVTVAALGMGLVATLAAVIYVIILLARDSDPRPNRYGPSPKYSEADAIFR